MKKAIIGAVVVLIIILSYIVVINEIEKRDLIKYQEEELEKIMEENNCWIINDTAMMCNITEEDTISTNKNGIIQEMGMQTNIATSIVRPRWYGTIHEHGNYSDLELLNLARLPLKRDYRNYANMHIAFSLSLVGLIVFVLLTIMIINLINKYEKEYEDERRLYQDG